MAGRRGQLVYPYNPAVANSRRRLFLGGVTDAIGDAASSVGGAIGDAGKAVGQGVWTGVRETGEFVADNPKLTGTVLGAAAAPFTGGLSLQAGMALGSTAGSVAKGIKQQAQGPQKRRRGRIPPQMRGGYVGTPGYIQGGAGGSYTRAKGGALMVKGRSHEDGGIKVSGNAEIEGGESLGRVGGKGHAFSKRLKVPGTDMTFADMHQQLTKRGASQDRINQLADLQAQVAGRGDRGKLQDGGVVDDTTETRRLPSEARGREIPNPVGKGTIGMTGATQNDVPNVLSDFGDELSEEGEKIRQLVAPYLRSARQTATDASNTVSSAIDNLIGRDELQDGGMLPDDVSNIPGLGNATGSTSSFLTDVLGSAEGVRPPVNLPNMPFQPGGRQGLPINMTRGPSAPPSMVDGPLANRLLVPPSPKVSLVSPDNQVIGSNPSFSGSLPLPSGQASTGNTGNSGPSLPAATPEATQAETAPLESGPSVGDLVSGGGGGIAGRTASSNASGEVSFGEAGQNRLSIGLTDEIGNTVGPNQNAGGSESSGLLNQAGNTLDSVLPFLPGAVNAARGLFDDAEGINLPRVNIPERSIDAARNMDTDINVRPQMAAADQAFRSIVANPNMSNAQKQSAFSKLLQNRSEIKGREENKETQLKNKQQRLVSRLMSNIDRAESEANQRAATAEAKSQQRAEAAKQNLLSTGITQLSRTRQRQNLRGDMMRRNLMGVLAGTAGAPQQVREDVLGSIIPLVQDEQLRNSLLGSISGN